MPIRKPRNTPSTMLSKGFGATGVLGATAWSVRLRLTDETLVPGGVFVFCRETADGHDFHARMFAPGLGVPEDPATGSAAAAFAGLLARFGHLADGLHEFAIEQGYEMGRPSLIRLTVTMRRGTLDGACIAGDAVMVTEGTLEA